jgi:hypothetical protein
MGVRGPLSLRARLKSHHDNPRRTNARRGRRSKEIDMTTINDRRTAIVQGGLLAADAAMAVARPAGATDARGGPLRDALIGT